MKKFKSDKEKRIENIEIIKGLTMITQLGFLMVTTILIGVGIGILLDKLLDTKLVFTGIFSVLAMLAAFRNMYYYVMKK